jgi:alkylated DNA repair dioxygenase AlkB
MKFKSKKLGEDAKFSIISKLPDEVRISEEQFEEFYKQKPKKRGKINILGKDIELPRFCKSYGKSYFFSGKNHKADPMDAIKIDDEAYLVKCVNLIKKDLGLDCNQVLVNYYDDLQSYIGDHSDDEKAFVSGSPVICFNFCKTPRDIVIKNKLDKSTLLKHSMTDNSGYMMLGERFQKDYLHGVPKRVSKEHRDERRISLTFRNFK